MMFPTKKQIEGIRAHYPKGMRVELVSLEDPYSRLCPGDKGTVELVDDIGTIFVHWDCGSSLGIVSGVDLIRPL